MPAFAQRRTARRAERISLSQLVCLGRHTITGLACTAGRQDRDWTGDYRFFAAAAWQVDALFGIVIQGLLDFHDPQAPFVAAMDDTLIRKTGTHIPGVAYRRDPLSPPFHTNFVRGQRFLQVSGLLPDGQVPSPARAIPVQFRHVPPVPKPPKNATTEQRKAYRAECRRVNLSTAGAAAIRKLRADLDRLDGSSARQLVAVVDGSYVNGPVLKNLPERTTLIGRIRKDARLFYPPTAQDQAPRGTRRQYGQPAPTPEQILRDDRIPWQTVTAYAAGELRTFRVKTIGPVLWPKAGSNRPLRAVVVAPVGYRLTKGSRLLYRRAAFLICTDVTVPVEQLLQWYLWRWDIEVNHRDEKQIIGVGEAQVRAPRSVERDGPFAVASYAMVLLAAARTYGRGARSTGLPLPKWRRGQPKRRVTLRDLIAQLRKELWGSALEAIETHSDPFATSRGKNANGPECDMNLTAAVLCSAGA